MRGLVRQIPWDDAMRGVPSYRNLSFRRKEDRRAFPNVFELGLRHGLKFPVGLNGGHQIGQIFDRLALPYHDVHTYDELAIPFRCIATDIILGRPSS